MSSVSLCLIEIETLDDENTEASNIGLFKGSRKVRDITLKTFFPDLTNLDKESIIGKLIQTDTYKGIIHLYKENELITLEKAAVKTQVVCILSVPAIMTTENLLTFTAACNADVISVQILSVTENQYSAIFTFQSSKAAEEFFKSFNGIPFNYENPEWFCHLLFISSLEITDKAKDESVSASHIELPTCLTCLECMDESLNGVISISLNDSQNSIINSWRDLDCQVCQLLNQENCNTSCQQCNDTESLWVCLICGNIGCSRYLKGHAYQHYVDTRHCYALQLGTKCVWDYIGDNFVHRLLQSNSNENSLADCCKLQGETLNNKVKEVEVDYSCLIPSQLESQRLYYEDIIKRKQEQMAEEKNSITNKLQQIMESNKMLNYSIDIITKEKIALDKKIVFLETKVAETQNDVKDETELNKSMKSNIELYQKNDTKLRTLYEKMTENHNENLNRLKNELQTILEYFDKVESDQPTTSANSSNTIN